MKLEIRQANPEEMVDFKRVAETALMSTMDHVPAPDQTLCGFVDGKLVTSYAAWSLTVVMNGKDVPSGTYWYVIKTGKSLIPYQGFVLVKR